MLTEAVRKAESQEEPHDAEYRRRERQERKAAEEDSDDDDDSDDLSALVPPPPIDPPPPIPAAAPPPIPPAAAGGSPEALPESIVCTDESDGNELGQMNDSAVEAYMANMMAQFSAAPVAAELGAPPPPPGTKTI